jgi:hypothetical protein
MADLSDSAAITAADAPPAGAESAAELFQALRRLQGEGRVAIRIEANRLDHIDSPVAVEADGNIWVYGVILLAVAIGWRAGIAYGLVTVGLGAAFYLTLGKAYIHRRIERRVRDQALASIDLWRKLWRFPGLTLIAAGAPEAEPCASPDGNWMAFVRRLR